MTVTIYDDRPENSAVRDLSGPWADVLRILERTPLKTSQLTAVLAAAGEAVVGSALTLYLLNREQDVLQEIVSHGHTVNVFEQLHFGGGTGLAGWVMRQRRPLYLRGRNPENDGVREHHNSLLFIPLRNGQEPMGLLAVSHPEPDGLDDQARAFLREIADLTAQALVQRVHLKRERTIPDHSPEDQPPRSRFSSAGGAAEARNLACQAIEEINQALAAITGNARMIELEAPQLPPAVAGHLQAVIEEARRITLISHKLSRLDRLLAGETDKSECQPDDPPLPARGEGSC